MRVPSLEHKLSLLYEILNLLYERNYISMYFIPQGKDPLPEFESDHYIMVSDWFQKTSEDIFQLVKEEAIG